MILPDMIEEGDDMKLLQKTTREMILMTICLVDALLFLGVLANVA